MKKREQKHLNKSKKGTDSSSSSSFSSPSRRRSTISNAASFPLRHPAGQREFKEIEIIVRTIMGKNISLNVTNHTTIRDIKVKLYQSEGIATENQRLVFGDQELSDLDSVKSLGLVNGSTIKLVVAMSGGPGSFIKKEKADDSVLLLLCRQNEELYMLELHMENDKTKPILLKAPSDLLENFMGETSSEEIEEIIDGSGEDEESIFDSARPTSTFSTSTVFSILSNGTSKILSRPTSSNSFSSASSSLLEEFLSAATRSTSLPGARPATAISIMRLPISSPLIILPKSRPASAIIAPIEVKEIKSCIEDKLENLQIQELANPTENPDQIKEFASKTHHTPCSFCKKKVSFSFKCKCGKTFCSLHRYSDRHSCSYDYAEAHRKTLRAQLPLVNGEKVINLN